MQLSLFLKVPITFFFVDYKDFKDVSLVNESIENLNFSFLTKTFSSLSKLEKEKVLQILRNSDLLEKAV